jgi:hypothetical protein
VIIVSARRKSESMDRTATLAMRMLEEPKRLSSEGWDSIAYRDERIMQ